MTSFRLLIVEDDPQDLSICRNTIERYQHERNRQVELVECPTLEEAFQTLDGSYDGVIIDLKLGNDQNAGNAVIRRIEEQHFRIPVAVLTGTPDAVGSDLTHIGVFKKGESDARYDRILDRFWKIYDTGLTRILGGRGLIENKLGQVFRQNLLPQIGQWEKYGEVDPTRTENALLRHILNHLIQLIDEEVELSFPEEFYLYPPVTDEISTGSIVQESETGKRFVVMSPDCDLVVRSGGGRNTDRILVVKVVPPIRLFCWFDDSSLDNLTRGKKRQLLRALRNNHTNYYHCLPETSFTRLGFMNFRNLFAITEDEFGKKFQIPPEIQISPPFVKDIVARFSSYYARQGQPDIDFDNFITL